MDRDMTEQEHKKNIKLLNRWAKAYYTEDDPLVSDEEYDKLYREVEAFEREHSELIDKNYNVPRKKNQFKKYFYSLNDKI